jgi:FAD/FMN-containing dehydrogenase
LDAQPYPAVHRHEKSIGIRPSNTFPESSDWQKRLALCLRARLSPDRRCRCGRNCERALYILLDQEDPGRSFETGNQHCQFSPNTVEEVEPRLLDVLYGEVTQLGGSISAEHGIGRIKSHYLRKR